jgi:tryptophan 2,3-dioxygenase
MTTMLDQKWRDSSIAEEERKERTSIEAEEEVRPQSYGAYIGLDQLLQCQRPVSKVPDERIFIITHQLFELVFKQMLFDFAVIAQTFAELDKLGVRECRTWSEVEHTSDEETRENAFWRPALTASARIKYSSEVVLLSILRYLGHNKEREETFSNFEFESFRDYLIPASGFQTAQFRLIQRALGKANLLTVKLFPADVYLEKYENIKESQDSIRTVIDKSILGKDAELFIGDDDPWLTSVRRVDDLAHKILTKFQVPTGVTQEELYVPLVTVSSHAMAEKFAKALRAHRNQQGAAKPSNADEIDERSKETFQRSLEVSIERENMYRKQLAPARGGALYLQRNRANCCLVRILSRLVDADEALHHYDADPTTSETPSFLTVHNAIVSKSLAEVRRCAEMRGKTEVPGGTGGGGIPYLSFMRKDLIPEFKGLIAYRNIADPSNPAWVEPDQAPAFRFRESFFGET